MWRGPGFSLQTPRSEKTVVSVIKPDSGGNVGGEMMRKSSKR